MINCSADIKHLNLGFRLIDLVTITGTFSSSPSAPLALEKSLLCGRGERKFENSLPHVARGHRESERGEAGGLTECLTRAWVGADVHGGPGGGSVPQSHTRGGVSDPHSYLTHPFGFLTRFLTQLHTGRGWERASGTGWGSERPSPSWTRHCFSLWRRQGLRRS